MLLVSPKFFINDYSAVFFHPLEYVISAAKDGSLKVRTPS